MASSGTIYGSWSGLTSSQMTLRCDWSVTSQNPANKTSTVQLKWIAVKYDGRQTWKQTTPWSRTVDGSSSNGTLFFDIRNVANNTDYVFLTQSVTIQHNANGTKTASISGTVNLSGTSAGTGSFSGSMSLPTIATTPPTVSALTVSDVGTGYSTVGAYVAGYTRFKLEATAAAVSPATIASYAFYNGSTLLYSGSSSSYTYASPNGVGTYDFKVVVTDNYGNATTKTAASCTVVAYSMPTIAATTFRCNSGGTADPVGAYASCKMIFAVANVGSNSAQVHQVKVGTLNAVTLTSGTAQVIGGSLSSQTTYDAVYTVTDKFGSSATITQTIPTEFVNLDMFPSATNGGIGVGMIAESGFLASALPIKAYKGIKPKYYALADNIDTLTKLNSTLLSEYGNLPDYSIGFVTINPSANFSPFGGGVTTFMLFRGGSTYGTIIGSNGINNTGCVIYKTSVYSGAITGWSTT